MNLLYTLLLFEVFVVSCFNIDTNNPVIYLDQTKYTKSSPSTLTSFFGLSVLLVPRNDSDSSWLQIGAPRGNSPSFRSVKNPGIIFRCEISKPCKYVEIDRVSPRRIDNRFDNAWIGATMDVSLVHNITVVCAPRWISVHNDYRGELDYKMLGACYWANLDKGKFHKRTPLHGTNYIYTDPVSKKSVYNWGQGEAGVSVHMPEDKKEIFMGAPGVFNWKGSTSIYRDVPLNENPIVSRYTSYVEDDPRVLSDVDVADAKTSTLREFGLFGYSVTSGRFYSKKLLYVGGAPRSQNYIGQVHICYFGEEHNKILNVTETKGGSQFGEYFGAAVAAGDINQDGYDDLFVGAPFYQSSKYNEGRMYLYLGSSKGSLEDPVVGKIDGTHTNGQFGTAITYLGDLNGDGNRYVAVAAPYAEEGSGVVYIFKGLRDSYGIDPNPVQTIMGKTFLPDIRGFGISISKPADIDGNQYKDIAIGAYQSGHVVLLRSRPLVIVKTYINQKPKEISIDVDDFSVEICHKFEAIGGMDAIKIQRTIVVDENIKRAYLFGKKEEAVLEVNRFQANCETLKIKLRRPLKNDFEPLTLSVTHNFIEQKPKAGNVLVTNISEGVDNFCSRCGVYDKFRSIQTVDEMISFSLGCGADNVCNSELSFNTTFNVLGNRTDTFIRGSTNVIDLEVNVRNDGEKAFLLRVQVDLPKGLRFKKRPTLCEQNQTSMTCSLANPLGEGKEDSQILKLDMEYVNQKIYTDSLDINVTLLTNSVNKNKASKVVKLHLKTEADVMISGKSGEQSYGYGNDSNSNVEFEQTYLIGKFGLSPVASIAFEIYVPYAIKTKTENITFISLYQPVGLLEGQPFKVYSNLSILEVNRIEFSEGIGDDRMKDLKLMREKRDVGTGKTEILKNQTKIELGSANLQQDSVEEKFVGTTTFEISCDGLNVQCGRVFGHVGPFKGSENSAVIQLKLVLDVKNISALLPKNAIIKYSTSGAVRIKDPENLKQNGNRPDMTVVSSLFLNDANRKKIDLWIIIVSAALGLLLLLLITLGLTKAGFFKRAKKEELEQLKAQAGYKEGQTNASDEVDEPTTE